MEDISFRGLVLRDKSLKPRLQALMPYGPFEFLKLPIELQRLVIAHYFGRWSVVLDYERYSMFKSKFKVLGVPAYNILLTCRAVGGLASEVRYACFTGKLTLNSVFILIPLRKKLNFDWLKRNVRTLHFSDSSVNPERWSTYFTGFDRLRTLEIDLPSIVRLDSSCLDLEKILSGAIQHPLIDNLQYLQRGLLTELPDNVRLVVGQRYCLKDHLVASGWKGIINAKVIINPSDMFVTELSHDPLTNIMSKREFTRPREL